MFKMRHRKEKTMVPFPNEKYSIIYADPPWEYKESGGGKRGTAGLPYPTMSTEEICKLPVEGISKETSILFIWATFRKLEECLEVIKSWGFEYYGLGFDWMKTGLEENTIKNMRKSVKDGSELDFIEKLPFFGMGYYTRQNNEVCLIGVKANPKSRIKPVSRGVRATIISPRREHSRKPDEVRDNIVKICGDIPRIELFARQRYKGWDCWGNEVSFTEEENVV